ncbi:MAG: hypothetical protein IPO32_19290 [Crocinitomicaceae bacterium]|nr:hypothetical protein [Crocinitomicaceae bacterium]
MIYQLHWIRIVMENGFNTRLVEGHPIEQEVYAFNNPDAGKHKLVIEPKNC